MLGHHASGQKLLKVDREQILLNLCDSLFIQTFIIFCGNYRFTGSFKRGSTERPHVPFTQFHPTVIFSMITAQYQSQETDIDTMRVYLYHLVTSVQLCNYHQDQDRELIIPSAQRSPSSYLPLHSDTQLLTLTPSNHKSVSHLQTVDMQNTPSR